MPATSAKQYGLMAGVAHGKIKLKGLGADVAKKFVAETPSNKRSAFMKAIHRGKKGK